MAEVAAEAFGVPAEDAVVFADGMVRGGGQEMSFADAGQTARTAARVSLSSTGYYRTPKIHYDSKTHARPAVLLFRLWRGGVGGGDRHADRRIPPARVDILHDCGASLNPAIDLGQIEGGFVQGMGWLTSEELWWDAEGRLRTHAPSTYKIPACGDVPAQFNVAIYSAGRNREDAIYRSKAVGEPPLMLGISVFHAMQATRSPRAGDGGCRDRMRRRRRNACCWRSSRARAGAAPGTAKAAE